MTTVTQNGNKYNTFSVTFVTLQMAVSQKYLRHHGLPNSTCQICRTFVTFEQAPCEVCTQLHKICIIYHKFFVTFVTLQMAVSQKYLRHHGLPNSMCQICKTFVTFEQAPCKVCAQLHKYDHLLKIIGDIRHVHDVPCHGFPHPTIGIV